MNQNGTLRDDIEALLPHVKLNLEVSHPALEECYAQGYQMAQQGYSEEDNPFSGQAVGSRANELGSDYWAQGWWDGYYEAAPAFELGTDIDLTALDVDAEHLLPEATVQGIAANDTEFQSKVDSLFSTIAKLAAAIAGAILSYQVIDMIA